MRIIFVRHGEPDYARDCLTDEGRRQAAAAAERLAGEGISEIYASPCGRAMETARYTARRLGLPVVTLDHAYNHRTAVLSDNVNGMMSLVRYVYGKGHRRIAYIHGNPTAVTENRRTGFFKACEELGIDVPDAYIRECEYHEPNSCCRATKEVLALKERPSCIFFSDDYSYIGGANAIAEAGLRVPEDISVVGYDGIHMAKVTSPRLTTWEQNTAELGRLAADKLIERIEHPRTALPEHIVVQGRLLEGGTVKQLN